MCVFHFRFGNISDDRLDKCLSIDTCFTIVFAAELFPKAGSKTQTDKYRHTDRHGQLFSNIAFASSRFTVD